LHERILPKGENMSYKLLLSMFGSRFFTNTFARPLFRMLGSRWENVIRMGFPFNGVKFRASSARVAESNNKSYGNK
jgi:hypothetical protein